MPFEKQCVLPGRFVATGARADHSTPHLPRAAGSYYASTKNIAWPPEVHDYNEKFTKCLQKIKTRHDPTVMTVACVSSTPSRPRAPAAADA